MALRGLKPKKQKQKQKASRVTKKKVESGQSDELKAINTTRG
jgi:hypothetical protein